MSFRSSLIKIEIILLVISTILMPSSSTFARTKKKTALSDLRPPLAVETLGNPLLSETERMTPRKKRLSLNYTCRNSMGRVFQATDSGYEACISEENRQRGFDHLNPQEPGPIKVPGGPAGSVTLPPGLNKISITIEH